MSHAGTDNSEEEESLSPPSSEKVEIARISRALYNDKERWAVIKWGMACFTFLMGLIIVGLFYLEATKPAWLTLVLAILGAISGSGIISIPIIKLYRRTTRRLNKRIKPLENKVALQQIEIERQHQTIALLQSQVNSHTAESPGLSEALSQVEAAVPSKLLPSSSTAQETTIEQQLGAIGGDLQ